MIDGGCARLEPVEIIEIARGELDRLSPDDLDRLERMFDAGLALADGMEIERCIASFEIEYRIRIRSRVPVVTSLP